MNTPTTTTIAANPIAAPIAFGAERGLDFTTRLRRRPLIVAVSLLLKAKKLFRAQNRRETKSISSFQ